MFKTIVINPTTFFLKLNYVNQETSLISKKCIPFCVTFFLSKNRCYCTIRTFKKFKSPMFQHRILRLISVICLPYSSTFLSAQNFMVDFSCLITTKCIPPNHLIFSTKPRFLLFQSLHEYLPQFYNNKVVVRQLFCPFIMLYTNARGNARANEKNIRYISYNGLSLSISLVV